MNAKELYVELMKPKYDQRPYQRLEEWGDGMEILKEVILEYWRERFLINHQEKEAYELMNRDFRLLFLTQDDVDWEGVETLENNRNAYTFSAYYQRFAVDRFKNGVASVKWTIYPDGRYFMDEDGYGMEDNEESALYGYIDRKARVVLPFQAIGWKEADRLRPEAEKKASELAREGN